jgi:S-DNA-T family DNA segregation ATPase FtsK/SpoIIIE
VKKEDSPLMNKMMIAVLATGTFLGILAINPLLSLGALTIALFGGASALSIGDAIFTLIRHTKLDRYFEKSNMQINGNIPKVLKTEHHDNGDVYVVAMPAGMSTDDFEKRKLSIEQYLGESIKIGFNKNLIIETKTCKLEPKYNYVFFETEKPLEVCIGHTEDKYLFFDLEQAPHLLVSGATGMGKSCFLRSILCSFILSDREIDLHLVDFQKVELGIFKDCGKVLDFCSEPYEFEQLLKRLKSESHKRLKLFDEKHVVNISGYNHKVSKNKLKYKIVVIDEIAALATSANKRNFEELQVRIAQDRKCGIHYILACQRPSVDIINGSIKNNIPARISFKMVSQKDSEVILDRGGAELLTPNGHGLLNTTGQEFRGLYLSEQSCIDKIQHTFINKQVKEENKIAYITRPPHNPIY